MKKIISALMLTSVFSGAFANDVTKITSKTYVDTEIAKNQDVMPAVNANTVLTHTNTAGVVGQKAIYDATENYVGQETALVTAGTADSAIQMAIEGEFVCANAPTCTLWTIRTQSSQQILPTGYTALEYLESNGGQYLSTNIPWTSVYRFSGKAQQTAIDLMNRAVFGSSTIQSNNVLSFWGTRYLGSQNLGSQTEWYWNTNIPPTTIAQFDILRDDATSWHGTVNNVATQTTSARFSDNVIIMGDMQTWTYRVFNGKVWGIQLYGGTNNLIFNGVPARRDSDDEIGMYDTVTNTFFTNAGNGTFTAGPDLNVYMPSGN